MLDVSIKSKSYLLANGQQLEVLRDLSFSVNSHSFTCIVGPSGCGKSTTIRLILGLEEQPEASIKLDKSARVSAVFQEPRLLPWRTVRENVDLCLPKDMPDEDLSPLFEVLGLSGMMDFYPSELSLGLARRVALARAFAIKPELLILDEPFVSLDEQTAARLRDLLMSVWLARPTTAVMVTHNLHEAAALADRIVVFSERPAHVIGCLELDIDRDQRDHDYLDSVVSNIDQIVTSG